MFTAHSSPNINIKDFLLTTWNSVFPFKNTGSVSVGFTKSLKKRRSKHNRYSFAYCWSRRKTQRGEGEIKKEMFMLFGRTATKFHQQRSKVAVNKEVWQQRRVCKSPQCDLLETSCNGHDAAAADRVKRLFFLLASVLMKINWIYSVRA